MIFLKKIYNNKFFRLKNENKALWCKSTFSKIKKFEKVKSILDFEKWTKINVQN
jgi:hypothetical protein